jgi:hypothetical protein
MYVFQCSRKTSAAAAKASVIVVLAPLLAAGKLYEHASKFRESRWRWEGEGRKVIVRGRAKNAMVAVTWRKEGKVVVSVKHAVVHHLEELSKADPMTALRDRKGMSACGRCL